MFCYKAKFLLTQKYNILMLKDEIQIQHANEIEIIKLNSFEPRFKWSKCDISEIGQFEILNNQNSRIYKIDPTMGMLLKQFLNGKVCFQGINNQFKIAKIISNGNSGSIVKMRHLYNDELLTCKIYKQTRPEFEQKFQNEVQALQILKHKNLPKIREYYIEANHNYIIYDLLEGTPLDTSMQESVFDTQDIILIMKELIRVVQFMKSEGYSHQNIKLENIYYCPLMNQITVVNFGKSIFRNQSNNPGDSYFSKTTKDYTYLNTYTSRSIVPDKDIFDSGIIFFQLIKQQIIDCKEYHYLVDNNKIMSLITQIHNQHISTFLLKLFQQNKTQDKSNIFENLIEEIESLKQELQHYRNN